MATLLLIGFEGLLRLGEMASLRRDEVCLPCDGQGLRTSMVVVRLRVPETRRQAARRQSVVIRRASVVTVLVRRRWAVPPRWNLCTGGVRGLRASFRYLLKALGCRSRRARRHQCGPEAPSRIA